jgi:transposase
LSGDDCSRALGRWEGYRIGTVQRFEAGQKGPRAQVWIELVTIRRGLMRCSGCGRFVSDVHDFCERWIRDLPILGADTWLVVFRRRVSCPRCGPKLEWLPWLGKYSRVTKRLAESVAKLCELIPIKQVAEYFKLNWKTVKTIHKQFLKEALGPVDLSDVQVIGMDEFAIHKGHRYATVVVDPRTKRVLWVGRGRARDDVRPFFDLLGQEGRRQLKAVVMDMNAAYEEEVRANCPHAEIVYDLFHVAAKYGREVIDRVRVDEANRLRDAPKARKVVKGSRWLLLRNRENITRADDRIRLSELLRANRKLATVYVLKDDLKHLWDYIYPKAAQRFWDQWYRRAIRSRIDPLKRFARNLKERLEGILAHCRWPLHTSLLEGINNKIKVIKRMAYGFRDDDYFFLRIRAAFPGNGR